MATNINGYETYLTTQGDTFDILALRYYNDEMKASLIINANTDYCDMLIFDMGILLQIPIVDIIEIPETLPPWRRGE